MNSITDQLREHMGDCPICGGKFWYNDFPYKAHCWGSEENEHKEYSKVVPQTILDKIKTNE